MVPGSPELLFVVLLFLVLSVPVLIWAAVALNRAGGGDRATGESRDGELAQLRRQIEDLTERVERLESHQDESEQGESERFGTEWE